MYVNFKERSKEPLTSYTHAQMQEFELRSLDLDEKFKGRSTEGKDEAKNHSVWWELNMDEEFCLLSADFLSKMAFSQLENAKHAKLAHLSKRTFSSGLRFNINFLDIIEHSAGIKINFIKPPTDDNFNSNYTSCCVLVRSPLFSLSTWFGGLHCCPSNISGFKENLLLTFCPLNISIALRGIRFESKVLTLIMAPIII